MRKLLSVFTAFAMALTILTGSIALPLVARPFYRAQIEPLGIPARSGLTAEQIGAAFDDVMDYCLGKRRTLPPVCCPSPRRGPATSPMCGGCFCWTFGCWRCAWRCCWCCTLCGGKRA